MRMTMTPAAALSALQKANSALATSAGALNAATMKTIPSALTVFNAALAAEGAALNTLVAALSGAIESTESGASAVTEGGAMVPVA